jgi:hypothetical protein
MMKLEELEKYAKCDVISFSNPETENFKIIEKQQILI